MQIWYRTIFALWLTSCSLIAVAQTTSQQIEAIEIQRQGLLNLMRYIDQTPDIFSRSQQSNLLLNRTEKEEILDVWVLYLDYMSTLSILADHTEDYLRLSGKEREEKKHVHALAFNAHYRFGLEFIDRLNDDPEIQKWLNRAHPDHNLEKNLYRKFSQQILSDWSTDLFDDFNQSFSVNPSFKLSTNLAQDQTAIRNLNRFGLLTSNSTHKIRRSLYNTYYPVQKGVARGMGKVKVWRIGNTLITPEQALEFSYQFEPGDFYLTRKEWRLTNVGIPGFWTHSAIFIGTPAERALYFNTPEVNDWVESQGARSFEDLLKQASDIYAVHPGRDANGDIRVIEALDAGVIFNSIETSLDADGAAVFRPITTKLEKAKAIYNSFYYTGQPYDFHFDFDSDDAIVCSELIFKSYQASDSQTGIPFPLNKAVGKKMLTPSEIAQWYDDTVGTPEQKIDLVMFIDSNEKDGVAFQSTKEAFIGSWKRPDWYLFQQPKRESDQIAAN